MVCNIRRVWASAGGVLLCILASCGFDSPVPATSAAIESVGMLAGAGRQPLALQQLESWSTKGSAVASRELALAYLLDADKAPKARPVFLLAANQGDAPAAFMLGEAARLGTLQAPDLKSAWDWYELAAQNNHAEAALMLGRMAANGEGIAANQSTSVRWLIKSARLGSSQAMFLLFSHYAQPGTQEPEWALARHLLYESAHKHYPPAMQALALALEGGDYGFKKDRQQALFMMKEAGEESRNRWNVR